MNLNEDFIKEDINLYYLLNDVILKSIMPYINKIKENGLKYQINKGMKNVDFDEKIILLLKKHLSPTKIVEISPLLGSVTIQYRNEKIYIYPSGIIGLAVNEINIDKSQLLMSVDDIIDQLEKKYITNVSYINMKFRDILVNLCDKGVYKPETAEEKTIYDLLVLILLYNDRKTSNLPDWLKPALNSLKRADLIKDLINSIVDFITSMISTISENIYLDLRLALDSKLVRITLNKKTNKGQISGLLSVLGIDINEKIDKFLEDYLSASFIRGIGQLVTETISSILCDVNTENNIFGNINIIQDSQFLEDEPFNITMCMGRNPIHERAFRWFTKSEILDGEIQYSESEDFCNAISVKSDCERIIIPKTVLNFGLISKYSTEECSRNSVIISNLKPNTQYWYRVGNNKKNIWSKTYTFKTPIESNEFTFINLSDSQGMIKDDYDLFIKTFRNAIKNVSNAEFVTHLGDFVDDGNNEDYWGWVLNSNLWKERVLVPLSGNHELWVSNSIIGNSTDNPIVRHFYISNIPHQDLSSGVYYSYTYKDVTFIVLNTNDINSDYKISDEQFNWAYNTAMSATTKWKIILMHKSIYSNGPHSFDDDVKGIMKQIVSLCDKAKIDIVFSGHDHVYVRTPFMKNNNRVFNKTKLLTKSNIKYETAINPEGTLYIMPGTSGVKNYNQDLSIPIITEKVSQPYCPTYSKVEVTDNVIYFTAYKYNVCDNSTEVIDSYAIEKTNSNNNFESVEKKFITKGNKQLKFVVVGNKKEFLQAINDEDITNIVTNGSDINLEDVFGRSCICLIKRNLEISGSSRIARVCFKIQNYAKLTISGNVYVDNTRKKFSIYPSINNIELYENTILELNDNVTLKTEFGTGKSGYCILQKGRNSKVIVNSNSENFGSKGVIKSTGDCTSVILNSGKYSAYKGNYALNISGNLVINNAIINGLIIKKDAEVYMNNGIINNNKGLYAVDITGKFYILGGKVSPDNAEKSINLTGELCELHIIPDHDGSVQIGNKIAFFGNMEEDLLKLKDHANCNVEYSTIKQEIKYLTDICKFNFTNCNIIETNNKKEMDLPKGQYYLVLRKYFDVNNELKEENRNAYIYSKIKYTDNK